MNHGLELCITHLCFESHMSHNHTEGMITSCLIIRPLPEEEELDDELFAGTSEERDPGNENKIAYIATVTQENIKGHVHIFSSVS